MNVDTFVISRSRFGTAPLLVSIVSQDDRVAFEARPITLGDQRLRISGQRDAHAASPG